MRSFVFFTTVLVIYAVQLSASLLSTDNIQASKSSILHKRGGKKTAWGAFGPHGLLGSVNPNGSKAVGARTNTPNDDDTWNADTAGTPCFGKGCAAALIVEAIAVGISALVSWAKAFFSFHNGDKTKWPDYDSKDALWAVRLFRDTGCGSKGGKKGANPYAVDSKKGPVMIAEFKGTSMKIHDNQPCQNFMTKAQDHKLNLVKSIALWISSSMSDAAIYAFSDPTCKVEVNLDKDGKPTTAPVPRAGWENWVTIFDGKSTIEDQGDDRKAGAWICLPEVYNAFTVVQVGGEKQDGTNMTVQDDFYDQNGGIPPAKTVPRNLAQAHAAFAKFEKGGKDTDWFTDNIGEVPGPAINPAGNSDFITGPPP